MTVSRLQAPRWGHPASLLPSPTVTRERVVVGIAGAGYGAWLHLNGYRKVHGIDVELRAVADVDSRRASDMAHTYGFEKAVGSFDDLLADDEIDVIDICTPPSAHLDMVGRALAAGKHVICEKPLTGYFGRPGDPEPVGSVPKSRMYEQVVEDLDRLRSAVESSGRRFMYAENFVYSPLVQMSADIIRAKGSRILLMKGEESLKGSSSPVAGEWKHTGGGSLIRIGSHPLGGALWLKQQEARARGERIGVASVVAETGRVTDGLSGDELRHITARPVDVEDFASVTITFTDGSKALIVASDTSLGGTRNLLEIYCNDAVLDANLTPTNMLETYFLDEEGIEDFQLAEMLPSKLGWNKAFVADEVIRGYTAEIQDFMETVAHDREPLSGFDLAADVTRVIYAAYLSAEEGRRVEL